MKWFALVSRSFSHMNTSTVCSKNNSKVHCLSNDKFYEITSVLSTTWVLVNYVDCIY